MNKCKRGLNARFQNMTWKSKNPEWIENASNTDRRKSSFRKYQMENVDLDKPLLKKIRNNNSA